MHACTIIAKNYISYARVLNESFFRHHPDGTFSVLIVDDYRDYIDPEEESFEVIDIGDIGVDNFQEMLGIYELIELTTAVKPWLLRTLLDRGYEDVIYLDPDIQIFESLDDVAEASRKHGIVLTPHVTEPMPKDGKMPDEAYILRAGTFNLGFIGIGQGKDTEEFLSWWQDHLATECVSDPDEGYFVDQKWIDFVPSLYPRSDVLYDRTLNVAYWNLPTRNLTCVDDDYFVNGEPLRFFHFSGFDPSKPHLLSKFQDRIMLSDEPALRKICREYSDKVHESGYEESCKWNYTYSTLPNGASFEGNLKRLHIKAMEEGETFGDLFTSEGVTQFFRWLNEPASRGVSHGVTRYLYEIYMNRRDMQERFPDLDGPDGIGLIKWAKEFGKEEEKMHEDLIPEIDQDALDDEESKDQVTSWKGDKRGVNVAGYFSAELGVGQAGRAVVNALEASSVPITTTFLKRTENRQEHAFASRGGNWNSKYAVNIVCANADQTEIIFRDLGVEKVTCGYSIGLWFWEVEQFSDQWPDAFKLVDEIWAASDHAARAIADISPKPVTRVRLPITVETRDFLARGELGIEDGFTFLFIFDYLSVVERKNPFGLIRAYTEAFSEKEGPKLLIKTINGDKDVEGMERLQNMVAERSDIEILDGYKSQQELDSLIATCDCYVSLHRAEGLGLTMGEAMYLGKPVIATGYSGNMEFMNNENSYLVDYDMVPIGDGSEPYPSEGKWAEPDIKHAVELMRDVFNNPKKAKTKGMVAAEQIRKLHSPEVAGQIMLKRLQTIASWKPKESDVMFGKDGLEDLLNRVSAGPYLSTKRGGKIKRLAKQSSLGLTKPYSNYQQGINSRVVDRLCDLDSMSKGLDDQLKDHGDELKTHDDQLKTHDDQLRRHDDEITGEKARLNDLVERVEMIDESLKRLYRSEGAVPYHTRHPMRSARSSADARLSAMDEATDGYSALLDNLPNAPIEPMSIEYYRNHQILIEMILEKADFVHLVASGEQLPERYGVGFDERVIEFPWIVGQKIKGRALDAGATLNHSYILDRVLPIAEELHVVTLEPDGEECFPYRGVSYIWGDLRELPITDNYYDTVVCLSTLEHIGMDVSRWGGLGERAKEPHREMLLAVSELKRVVRPGGSVFVSVPYGIKEEAGWYRQLDQEDVESIVDVFSPTDTTVNVFKYGNDGWQISSLSDAERCQYHDVTRHQSPASDRAAAARAIACIRMVK